MWKSVIAAAVLAACVATAAHAAKIEVDQCHDANDTQCHPIIFIMGENVKGDGAHFNGLVKSEKIGGAVVMLRSPGGALDDAITIGAIIHESGFLTFIGDNGECASACADIWLAGKVRYVSEAASIGFHRASVHDKKTGKYLGPSKSGDALQNAYYQRLGLTEAAIRYLLSADPHNMTWLDGAKAYEIGIIATAIKPAEAETKTDGRCQDENGNAIVCNGEGGPKVPEREPESGSSADILSPTPLKEQKQVEIKPAARCVRQPAETNGLGQQYEILPQ